MVSLKTDNVSHSGFQRRYTCIPDFASPDKDIVAAYHRGSSSFPGVSFLSGAFSTPPAAAAIDTSGWVIHDQESEKSCVGYAVSTVREHYAKATDTRLSPLFIYWWARKLDNIAFQDGGSRIINAMKCLRDYGVCEEQYHRSIPGTNRDVFLAPDTTAMVSAKKYIVSGFSGVSTLPQIKEAIAAGNPVVAGIPVFESMESRSVSDSGHIPVPSPSEKLLGGHAIVLIAYDDATQLVKFHNSWGTYWGDKGCGYIPYQFLLTNYFDGWELSAK